MNTYFKVIDDLKDAAIAEPFVNKVTQGDITEIDLNRSNIYPLCHLQVQMPQSMQTLFLLMLL